MKFIYAAALIALFAATSARADLSPTSGMLYLYGSSSCSGSPSNIIPVGSANVDCAAISELGNYYISGIRLAGDTACVSVGGSKTTLDVCKAYNVK